MATYKVKLSDGETTKNITVTHPKIGATDDNFTAAGNALATAYDLDYIETSLSSETVVHVAD